MKRFFLIILCLFTAGCSNIDTTLLEEKFLPTTTNNNSNIETDIFYKSSTNESSILFPTVTDTPTPALTPSYTSTPTPKEYDYARNKIIQIMEEYNFIEPYYLSDSYWNIMLNRINHYGKASRITALEYHGNDYWMYEGAYSMNPETFYKQMSYLMENDFHFVTVHELRGFLEGWIDLPLRSVILTTDSGYSSQNSIPSMINQFRELEEIYGYKPHMQSYIWTNYMTPEETSECRNNSCWETFELAKSSGYFSIGTHTESHTDFSVQDGAFTKNDLDTSIQEIFDNLNIRVYSLTWPFEACTTNLSVMEQVGIKIGFGGSSKPILDAYVYKEDPQFMCLPRLFPPHGGGTSARPNGKTLQEMLEAQMEK